MSRRSRPQYRPDLGWILGVAFEDTLTRSVRLAQRFTCVRCCDPPRASSPHGLTAPESWASPDGLPCVQLPPARGCYQLAPQRTCTSNPVPMPGTPPRFGLRPQHVRPPTRADSADNEFTETMLHEQRDKNRQERVEILPSERSRVLAPFPPACPAQRLPQGPLLRTLACVKARHRPARPHHASAGPTGSGKPERSGHA